MSIQDDVNRLAKSGARRIVLSELQARDAITEARSAVAPNEAAANSGGIQSPLTEIARTTTTVTVNIEDSGATVIGTADVEVITSVTMRDARGYDYVFNFTAP